MINNGFHFPTLPCFHCIGVLCQMRVIIILALVGVPTSTCIVVRGRVLSAQPDVVANIGQAEDLLYVGL